MERDFNASVGDPVITLEAGSYGKFKAARSGVIIQGVDVSSTVVNGSPSDPVTGLIIVLASNVTLRNFTIQNAPQNGSFRGSGIHIQNGSVTIEDLKIVNNDGDGIYASCDCNNLVIKNNNITGNQMGVTLQNGVDNATLIGNDISNHSGASGINITSSNNVTIKNNIITSSGSYNVIISGSNNTNITNNTLSNSDLDLFLYDVQNETILSNALSMGIRLEGVNLSSASRLQENPTNKTLGGSVFFLNVSANLTGASATVRVYYNQTQIEQDNIDESTMTMWHYNSTSGNWEQLNTAGNSDENWLEANVTGFSTFGVTGSASSSASSTTDSSASHRPPPEQPPEPADLAHIDRFFKTNTIVVYGSEVDLPVAEALAQYFSPMVPLPVKTVGEVEKSPYRNLILIGGPAANRLTDGINDLLPLPFLSPQEATRRKWSFSIGDDHQGAGAIQIIDNPNHPYLKILIVAGLTREGTQRAGEMIIEEKKPLIGSYILL